MTLLSVFQAVSHVKTRAPGEQNRKSTRKMTMLCRRLPRRIRRVHRYV
jgi:hypothetical protein